MGVVGCIGAWNYPFQTCVWKVAPALAAGNAVVYKPSPFAPASPVLLGEILAAAGLPANVYNVLQGEADTGSFLCEHDLIRKVSFTGSYQTGMKIQQQCSKHNIKYAFSKQQNAIIVMYSILGPLHLNLVENHHLLFLKMLKFIMQLPEQF